MPYIPSEDRPSLDGAIDALAAAIRSVGDPANADDLAMAGRLNYALTRVVAQVFPADRYHRAALATGVLENVKQELYRRSVAPYEDEKIAANGDVPEYS
jgi:hypothetical protein